MSFAFQPLETDQTEIKYKNNNFYKVNAKISSVTRQYQKFGSHPC